MSKYKEDSYIFCAALMRARERTLLSEAALTKAAEAATVQEVMTILAEYGYGDGKPLENPRDFVEVLARREEETYAEVFSALPDSEELELFTCPKDYHNAKAALKAESLGVDPEKYMSAGGRIRPEAMVEMIREKNFVFFSTEMKEAIAEAEEVFGKGRDPQEIDIILDKACYREMLRRAEDTDNKFLTGYVRLLIDMLNVSAFVRLRQIGKPWIFFQKVFLEGGNVRENLYISGYEDTYQQLAEKFRPYGLGEIMEKGAQEVQKTGMYALMEKLCDDKRLSYIRDAKFVSFGLEPAAAFLIARENEIKNLRVILTGKIAGTPKEVILERLRKTYV